MAISARLRSLVKITSLLLLIVISLSVEAGRATATDVGLTQSARASVKLQAAPPAFSKAFAPATIGPGSISTLTFEINNTEATPVSDLAFTDTLPAGVVIATPAQATSSCGGVLAASDGGSTITFSGGTLGASSNCTLSVDVTSSMLGMHTNVSGDLTSSAGNSGSATADLTVSASLPGFSKSFAPATISLHHTSTLVFTIDNSASAANAFNLAFSDNLPSGLAVASPSNAVTNCGGFVSAEAGSTTIAFFSGFVTAGSSCTVEVDVVANTAGTWENTTGNLTSSAGTSGKAGAVLQVTLDSLNKAFIDDPVSPGGTATLEFIITNLDRGTTHTNITFSDDLDAALSGLVASGLPQNDVCGAGSTLSGTSVLTLSGGTLASGESCTFTVTLQVPAGAAPGSYVNTTSALSSDVGQMSGPASDTLVVATIPLLEMSFSDDPVPSGGTVTLSYTMTNTSATDAASDLAFSQSLGDVLPGMSITSLPANGFCGAGSQMLLISNPVGFQMAGGSLAAGASCTFDVVLEIPQSAANGTYTFTSSAPTGTVGGESLTGKPATDDLTVLAAPRLSKSFSGDPLLPGDTVTLEFTLTHSENAPAEATDIAFSDDLDAALSGLIATGLPANDVCGAGSQIDGTSLLTFSGGSLAPGASCTFSVTLQVPAAASPGEYTNTTGSVSATMSGQSVVSPAASDDLAIASLTFDKSFTDDPAVAAGPVTLEFTLDNQSTGLSATDISFSDDLEEVLPGLVATGLPANDVCGAGSQLAGDSLLTFSGGSLAPESSCTFSVTLQVPGATPSGEYQNQTSTATANVDGSPVVVDPAADTLIVLDPLSITKSFTDDPVAPGDTATLEFSITNSHPLSTVTDITFSDDLQAALSGLTALGLPAADVCGAGSQLAGTSLLNLTGGVLAPGASCTFAVTLQVPAGVSPGTIATNTTSQVTGNADGIPVSGQPATDELQVDVVGFSKAFDGPTTATGSPVLTFTLENLGSGEVSGLSFTDDLGAVLPGLEAVGLPASDVCGAGSQLSGTSILALRSGDLAAGASCTFSVTLQVPAATAPGSYPNTTSQLFSSGIPVSSAATDTLTVEPPPLFEKSFAPDSVGTAVPSTLVFTVDNSASSLPASNLAFTDNFPSGVEVADPANASTTCAGGTLTATPGTSAITYSGGTVPAGATCMVQVDVVSEVAGTFVNTSGALTSSSGSSGTASDTLTVNPQPVFSKAFAPNPMDVGGVSTLTFTIDNSASTVDAASLAFTDNLPSGLTVATPAGVATTCTGGTLTATAGSGLISSSGGTVAAGATCTVWVDVTSSELGDQANTTGELTSTLGSSGTASDTLTVHPLPTLSVSKSAAPAVVIAPGDLVTFTVSVSNTSPVESIMLMGLTDDVHGDVDGRGDCSLPQPIAIGGSYQCRFSVMVSGPVGDVETDTITATAEDGDGNVATAQATATVTLHGEYYFPFVPVD